MMYGQSDQTSETPDTQELWNILMRIAEPTDLLKTILDRAVPRPGQASSLGFIVMHNCTVTIHQPTPPASGDPL